MTPLPKSEIPNNEILIRYCLPGAFPDDQIDIPSSVYNDTELSCDWTQFRPDPRTSFHVFKEGLTRIISITVCDDIKNPRNPKSKGRLEEAWKQDILYDPIFEGDDTENGENLAHSLIKGAKKAAVVDILRMKSTWYDLSN